MRYSPKYLQVFLHPSNNAVYLAEVHLLQFRSFHTSLPPVRQPKARQWHFRVHQLKLCIPLIAFLIRERYFLGQSEIALDYVHTSTEFFPNAQCIDPTNDGSSALIFLRNYNRKDKGCIHQKP